MTDPRRPLRADAVRNRESILAAADAAFAQHGGALVTEDVARRAGVGIGTVFRHFPTKTDLVAAIVERRLATVTLEARALLDDSGGDALVLFFRRIVEQAAAKPAIAHALESLGVDAHALISRVGAELRRVMSEMLDRAQEAGTVRADIDVATVLDLVLTVALLESPDAAIGVIIDGLRATPSAPGSSPTDGSRPGREEPTAGRLR